MNNILLTCSESATVAILFIKETIKPIFRQKPRSRWLPNANKGDRQHEIDMPNANVPNDKCIPPASIWARVELVGVSRRVRADLRCAWGVLRCVRVGSTRVCVGSAEVWVGLARVFRYQHVGLGNAKWFRPPKRGPVLVECRISIMKKHFRDETSAGGRLGRACTRMATCAFEYMACN